MTKKERERAEALDRIRDALAACGPEGNATLLLIDDGGRPNSSGRMHKIELHVIRLAADTGRESKQAIRPQISEFLTINTAHALGYRLSRDEKIMMGGYGYSRTLEIAMSLAHAVGHPIYCQSLGCFAGASGWVQP